jgi:hypothetical protein
VSRDPRHLTHGSLPGTWVPPLSDPVAEGILTAAARLTAVMVMTDRCIPGIDRVVASLPLEVVRSAPSRVPQLVDAVVRSAFWTAPATDPEWRLTGVRPQAVQVRGQWIQPVPPAVVAQHPRAGFMYGHWLSEPYGSGLHAWGYLHVLGWVVVRDGGLKPWVDRLVGQLYLTESGSCIRRRIYPEHIDAGERLVRRCCLTP